MGHLFRQWNYAVIFRKMSRTVSRRKHRFRLLRLALYCDLLAELAMPAPNSEALQKDSGHVDLELPQNARDESSYTDSGKTSPSLDSDQETANDKKKEKKKKTNKTK